MKANLIDGSNIFVICWSIFIKDREVVTEADDIEFYKIFFMKMKQYLTTTNNIVCFEGKNSKGWRLEIYPEYKAQRESMRNKPNGEHFYRYLENVKEMLKLLPCKVIAVENCEGDDCIYTLAERFSHIPEMDLITIVSGDADLTQIANFHDNVKVYHPIKKQFVTPDPQIILYKTLVGDTTDNIKYKKGLGPSTFRKMVEDQEIWEKWVATPDDYDRVKQIRQIVDLRCCPAQYKNDIIKTFNETNWNYPNLIEFGNKVNNDDYLMSFITYTCNNYIALSTVEKHISNILPIRCNVIPNDIYPKFCESKF